MKNFIKINETDAWKNLLKHHDEIKDIPIVKLFESNSRFNDFSFNVGDILFDFSKQKISKKTLDLFFDLFKFCSVQEKMELMFSGEKINHTESKQALHVALRANEPTEEINEVLCKMETLVEKLNSGNYFGFNKKVITDVISLGIGGSDLGPRMVCNALSDYKVSNINIHFLNNIDFNSILKVLKKLNPKKTLCIVNSKSFSTIETLKVANILKNWFVENLNSSDAYKPHMIAVTANPESAIDFGILEDNIFKFWEWVGGRYSVWSAVGLPIAISIGMDNFRKFLFGANKMDEHFRVTDFYKNAPIIMACVGIWNNNFFKYNTLSINPYLDQLELFPFYLQQLEMESNGKSINVSGDLVGHATSPIIWGGVGCNNQHSYMQLLHQGTEIVPIDFIGSVNVSEKKEDLDKLLFASCISQSKALMQGNKKEINIAGDLSHKFCIGEKPSTTILFPNLTPFILGKLIALYEHKVFVQGIIWQIQSFDQWGVELGKKLTRKILPFLDDNQKIKTESVKRNLDSSTIGLLEFYIRHRKR